MASSKFFPITVLTSLLSIYTLLSVHTPCSYFEDQHGISLHIASSPPTLAKAEKVNLSLYYETLCPHCAKFIVTGLTKVFDREFFNIVNLRLVPYGNAHIQQPGDTVVCQHGPDECYLNSIEACAINSWPDVGQHYKFIYCVEKKFNQTSGGILSKEDAWKSCCKKLGLNPKTVQDCYDRGLEKKLLLKYANETDHLVPPHEYVPWVVVNKQPLFSEYQKFVHYVCVAYKGPKPKICRSLPPQISSAENANSNRLGCYKEEEHRK